MVVAVLPESVRRLLEERLPDWIETHWWTSPEQLIHLAPAAEIGWFDLHEKAPALAAVESARGLRWLNTSYTGVDWMPLGELAERGVTVTCGTGLTTQQVAEFAILTMLAVAKDYPAVVRAQDRHEWLNTAPGTRDLAGSRALILGHGAIGQAIERALEGLGVEVCAVSSHRPRNWRSQIGGFDWIVLAVPGTPETRGMIGAAELAGMKPEAVLVNFARADCVDQDALVEALRDKRIAAAILDLTDPEPLPQGHPLWSLGNAHVTMHLSGIPTPASQARAADRFLRLGPLRDAPSPACRVPPFGRSVVGDHDPAGDRLAPRRSHASDRVSDRHVGRAHRDAVGRTVRPEIHGRRRHRSQGSSGRMTWRPSMSFIVGLAIVAVSACIYWLANRGFDAGRGDLFYLADAFLHGRTAIDVRLGPNDVIPIGGRYYVPFAPFPAVALMPLVAFTGPLTADQLESGINAVLAAAGVGMCWWLLGRVGVEGVVDRLWLTVLFGFSTQILWVTTRGGVWHTGHLIATILTFACLVEVFGRQRAWLIGLFAGAAFLSRAPLAFAVPFYALLIEPQGVRQTVEVAGGFVARPATRIRWRPWALLAMGVAPSIVAFFVYNQVRFGTPFESGYALATLPPFLEAQRAIGLFSPAHIPMNLDYFLFHLPRPSASPPFFQPDGLGMSVLFTSPGLLFATQADWRRPRAWWLLGAAVAVLVPTLLYYGGGWLQYGYRYFLDSVPFVMALCGLAAVHRGKVRTGWRILIAFGVVIGAAGVYWAYHL